MCVINAAAADPASTEDKGRGRSGDCSGHRWFQLKDWEHHKRSPLWDAQSIHHFTDKLCRFLSCSYRTCSNKTRGTRNNYPPKSTPVGWRWISSGSFLLVLSWAIGISTPHSGLPLQSSGRCSHYQTRNPFPAQTDLSVGTSSHRSRLRAGPTGSRPVRLDPCRGNRTDGSHHRFSGVASALERPWREKATGAETWDQFSSPLAGSPWATCSRSRAAHAQLYPKTSWNEERRGNCTAPSALRLTHRPARAGHGPPARPATLRPRCPLEGRPRPPRRGRAPRPAGAGNRGRGFGA